MATMNMMNMMDTNQQQQRIILLFDLDCFYAQCERVRLQLPADVPLVMFQWNSALAVSYPARDQFHIKRGDSWDEVAAKSKNRCWRIHLHVLDGKDNGDQPHGASQGDADDDNVDNGENPVETSFRQIYRPSESPAYYAKLQRKDNGRRRYPAEGKACLQRYRVASQHIFQIVLESLSQLIAPQSLFTLERASIDEFYLDITEYCARSVASGKTGQQTAGNGNAIDDVMTSTETDKSTRIVGTNSTLQQLLQPTRTHDHRGAAHHAQLGMYAHACKVSRWIRQRVLDELGFTMSTGISCNKTMAKLAASYGKPDGQALLLPSQFPYILRNTKMRKLRNFGGKLGKRMATIYQEQVGTVQDASAITMADIANLSLPTLQRALQSAETARFVFYACRGIDKEPVKGTTGALVKSITAFKSFFATTHLEILRKWIAVMANEIVARVEFDSQHNQRYPRICTLHYHYVHVNDDHEDGLEPDHGTFQKSRCTKSIRLAFPHRTSPNKADELIQLSMQRLQTVLKEHEESIAMCRLGLAANTFVGKEAASIDRFLTQQSCSASPPTTAPLHKAASQAPSPCKRPYDADLEMAKKLQAAFDRENYVLSTSTKFKTSTTTAKPKRAKTQRIDSFFRKR